MPSDSEFQRIHIMGNSFDHRDTPLPVAYFERKYELSRVTIWRYRRGGLPAVGVGAKTFIRESDFVAFLERMNGQTVSATPSKKEVLP